MGWEEHRNQIGHLAFAMWASPDWQNSWFGMFSGYFDDSGDKATPALVTCGWVAHVEQWERFQSDWQAVLARFQLPYFHMKSLRQHKGHFAQFQDNQPQETDLMERLHRVVKVRVEKSFGAIVSMADYRAVDSEYMLTETFGHPFVISALATVHNARYWMDQTHPLDPIEYVFERGTNGWTEFRNASKSAYQIEPLPGDWEKQMGLQAADMVAWEVNRFYTRYREKLDEARSSGQQQTLHVRKSFQSLMQRYGASDWHIADHDELMKICRDGYHGGVNPIEKRVV